MKEILSAGFADLGLSFSEAAFANLEKFYTLLEERGKVMNLTAIHGEEDTARQHFLDCGALLKYVDMKNQSVGDIGAGAGFPGLVLKILEPSLSLTMLDSQQKRVAFQQDVCGALSLKNVRCLSGRAEEQTALRESFSVVTSRAVARLNILAELCLPLLKKGGTLAVMKGPEPEDELAEAEHGLRVLGAGDTSIQKYTIPSTDVVHSLIILRKERHTPAQYPRRFAQIKKQPL